MTINDAGQQQNCVLIETRGDLTPVTRAINADKSFARSTVSGLVVWQRPDISVARVGPKTLAVGSLGEVDKLVEVRLGTAPDLKIDDPLLDRFQALEPESALRLASRNPPELSRFLGLIFPPDLLAASQLLSLAVTLDNPAKAHLLVRTSDAAKAKELAASLQKDTARWLSLPGSDFVLSAQASKVDQKGENLDLRFDIPEGAARLLLQ